MLIWQAMISEQSLSNRHTTSTTFIGHHSQFFTPESLWKKLSLDLFLVKRLHAMNFITAWCALHALCNTVLLDIHANAGRYVICLLNYLVTMQCGRHPRKIYKLQLLSNIILFFCMTRLMSGEMWFTWVLINYDVC